MGPRLFRALLLRVADAPAESDADLLRRFAERRDEPAFAELVRRYGGLVWGQCRNLLPSEADAEDAFQATFLALARRPGAVRAAVGPYLHGVAYRVCLNARRLAGRRKRREVASATSEAERPVADSAWDAALAAVHAELHRLPESQREAFVLCVLEGRGLTDAAGHLGVKLGTLSARLSRAKQTLMDRLAAQGVVAGVVAVAALAPASATAALMEKAVQSAVGAAPEAVLALTHGVTTMATKFKLLAAAVLLACGLGLGVGSGWVANAQDNPKPVLQDKVAEAQARLKALLDEEKALRLRAEKAEREAKEQEARVRQARDKAEDRLRAEEDLEQAALKEKLAKAQAELERKLKDLPVAEFRYLHLTADLPLTVKEFEKQVKTMETDGYVFVGSVPMLADKKMPRGVVAETVVPTLVFRKAKAADKTADLRDYQQQLLLRYEDQKNADLQLRKRWEDLKTQQDQLQDQAKLSQAMEQKLRAEIAALEEQLKRNPIAVAPGGGAKAATIPEKQFSVKFDNLPWPKVLDWLAVELNLTLVDAGKDAPTGTCTLKLDRKVSAGELIDLLNEALAQQKRVLIRGEQTLRVQSTDKPAQASASVELGQKAAELAKAIAALAEKKFDGRKGALRLSVNGTVLGMQGDADAVKWAADLIGSLKGTPGSPLTPASGR